MTVTRFLTDATQDIIEGIVNVYESHGVLLIVCWFTFWFWVILATAGVASKP